MSPLWHREAWAAVWSLEAPTSTLDRSLSLAARVKLLHSSCSRFPTRLCLKGKKIGNKNQNVFYHYVTVWPDTQFPPSFCLSFFTEHNYGATSAKYIVLCVFVCVCVWCEGCERFSCVCLCVFLSASPASSWRHSSTSPASGNWMWPCNLTGNNNCWHTHTFTHTGKGFYGTGIQLQPNNQQPQKKD